MVITSESLGAEARNLCDMEMVSASREHSVPLGLLYAVAMTETAQQGALQPYALNIDGKPAYGQNLKEAEQLFFAAKARGAHLIDIGCMQINQHYHGARFASVSDMFNPRKNVFYAAQLLTELRNSEGSWTAAIARYHASPRNSQAQANYVCTVIKNMISSGFGSWTTQARSFCKV